MDVVRDAHTLISESIRAVLPEAAVKRALKRYPFQDLRGSLSVVAIGKAAWRMAKAASETLGSRIASGVVVTKYGHGDGDIPRMRVIEAGHPLPDANSLLGAKAVLELVQPLGAEDLVIFLVSGGGSALFELPLPGVTLEDTIQLTRQMLANGASISEINTIRKHLSAVKGGRFAQACAPAKVLAIVLSDVLGDPLDIIASGPAYPDASKSDDALGLLARYQVLMPDRAYAALRQETPKVLTNVTTEITGNVTALCDAAMACAKRLGYSPLLLTTALDIEAREAGRMLAGISRQICATGQPLPPPCAVILGGETVVHIQGTGKGGRNQELALAAAQGIAGLKDVALLSVGSDGTDGPTDAAGGIVTGDFAALCRERRIDIEKALRDNNSYHALKGGGGLIVTGPTGTNVNDLMVVMVGGGQKEARGI